MRGEINHRAFSFCILFISSVTAILHIECPLNFSCSPSFQVTDDDIVSDLITRLFQEAGVEDGKLPDDCLDVKGSISNLLSAPDPFNFESIPNKENRMATLLIEFMKFQNNTPVPAGIMTTTDPYYSLQLKGLDKPIVIKTARLKKLLHDHIIGFEKMMDRDMICYVMKVPRQLLLDNAE